jgi:hypothetical protein
MDGPVEKLLEIASETIAPLHTSGLRSVAAHLGRSGEALREILGRKNGFFCFESALRVFPYATVDESWGIEDWNDPSLWKGDYQGLAGNLFCFAEDLFGGQFFLTEDGVHTFDAETGDREAIASTLTEWAEKILIDYSVLTGHPLAHQWQKNNGVLRPRQRLMAKRPFVLGGKFEVTNLVALDGVRVMKNLGNLAHQIHTVPDGSPIQFDVR